MPSAWQNALAAMPRIGSLSRPVAHTLLGRGCSALLATLAASLVAAPIAAEARVVHPHGQASRKGGPSSLDAPLLATLVDTHSPRRVALDELRPSAAAFAEMLKDPVLGSVHPLEPQLLGLLRALARAHPLARFELVSGYRSPKLNEALRKKGHHVASHSQHSLGHAVDFRVIPDGETVPLDPRALAAEVRALGWRGGVGTYPSADDRFVHADVGPLRSW